MAWLYFLLLGGSLLFPLAWSFEKRVSFYKNWNSLFPSIFLTAIFFLVWDEIFTRRGVWGFNPEYYTGIKLGELPLEEVLFFVVIPYSCVFIYDCVGYFLPGRSYKYVKPFTLGLGIFLIIFGSFNFDRDYTFWNFVFTGLLLVFVGYKNPAWLSRFWVAYIYHLIPFFVVNGILTGSFIEDQVVWYNNQENLAVRFITIPVEDTMYSLLLLLMNINYYEYFKAKFAK